MFTDTAGLLYDFEGNLAEGTAALKSASNENLMEKWRLRRGEHIIFEMPRVAVVRTIVLNHIVHHRGQLSVYLRCLMYQYLECMDLQPMNKPGMK